jgi:hypothetical protein
MRKANSGAFYRHPEAKFTDLLIGGFKSSLGSLLCFCTAKPAAYFSHQRNLMLP